MLICNDKNLVFPEPKVKKIIRRDNIGYDFGGWSQALLEDNFYLNYKNFIFVNSSVSGLFFPETYNGKWTDIYLNGLVGDVKLFGSTINCAGIFFPRLKK